MPGTRSNEFFLARHLIEYWSAGSNSQMSGNVFNQHFLFVAKAAAYPRFYHPYAFDRQADHRCDHPSYMERHLCAGAHHQAIILIPPGQGDMRFDVGLLNFGHPIFLFEDSISFSKTLLNIIDIDPDLGSQVNGWVRVGKIYIFDFVVDHRRTRLHRFPHVDDRRDDFILDFDQAQCFFSDFQGFRGNHRHPVSHKTDLVIQREHIQRSWNGVRLTSCRVNHTR